MMGTHCKAKFHFWNIHRRFIVALVQILLASMQHKSLVVFPESGYMRVSRTIVGLPT